MSLYLTFAPEAARSVKKGKSFTKCFGYCSKTSNERLLTVSQIPSSSNLIHKIIKSILSVYKLLLVALLFPQRAVKLSHVDCMLTFSLFSFLCFFFGRSCQMVRMRGSVCICND